MPSFMFIRPLISEGLKYTERQKCALLYKIAGVESRPLLFGYCAEVKNIGSDGCTASLDWIDVKTVIKS